MVDKPDLLRPALIGGLIGGLLSVIPPFCCLNCCCCLNYILAGVIAAGLYARSAAGMNWLPQAGEGAAVGLIAGVGAGVIDGLVDVFSALVSWMLGFGVSGSTRFWGPGDIRWERFWRASDFFDHVPPFAFVSGDFLISVVFGALAGCLGGLIGILLLRRIPAPPAPTTAAPAAGAGSSFDPGL